LLELDVKNGCLKTIHPVIVPDLVMMVPLALPVITQCASARRESIVVRDQRSPLTVCAKVLAGVKTKAPHYAELTDSTPLVERAVRLSGVLNDRDAMTIRNAQYRLHIRRLTEKMYRQNRFCPLANGSL